MGKNLKKGIDFSSACGKFPSMKGDSIKKKVGCPFSTSRTMEKAMKKKTHKARRQAGRKECAE